jgi:CRP-like cAMP-binding protein
VPSVDVFKHDPNLKDMTAGTAVFSEGDDGDAMYVVVDGQVELQLRGQTLALVGPGEIFGEMAIVDHGARSASAVMKTDGRIVPVDRKRFTYLVQNTPYFAIEVMKTMADRLRRMDAKT